MRPAAGFTQSIATVDELAQFGATHVRSVHSVGELVADLALAKEDSSGVVLALASRLGGWSLWLDRGKPVFTWSRSTDPEEIVVRLAAALPAGAGSDHVFSRRSPGGPADVVLSSAVRNWRARVARPDSDARRRRHHGCRAISGGGGRLSHRRGDRGDVQHVSITFD
jgi:hypothetical protein